MTVRTYLEKESPFQNGSWRVFEQLESSNAYCLAHSLEPFTVVQAIEQTAGVGQRRAKWVSLPENSLCFSFTLPLLVSEGLSCLVALAVAEALEEYSLPLKIKWPNDIYLNDSKVAGILVEQNSHGIVIGIGVNVKGVAKEYQVEGRSITTLEEYGVDLSAEELLQKIMTLWNGYWYRFSKSGFAPFQTLWNKLDFLKGRALFQSDIYCGEAKGIGSKGQYFTEMDGQIKENWSAQFEWRDV